MGISAVTFATRAFVKVMTALAAAYAAGIHVNRDSAVEELLAAYKKLALRVHPDKGGRKEHMQELLAAKAAWVAARAASVPKGGRPPAQGESKELRRRPASSSRAYEVHARVVLLTYHGFQDLTQWHRFVEMVRAALTAWSVQRWCATFEACETGALHTHLVMQFTRKVHTTVQTFVFEGLVPNVRDGDYLGEGLCKRRYEQSVNRGFWYVYADKIGTQRETDGRPCVAGNHVPVWQPAQRGQSRYAVLGKWCESLWKERKLDHSTYERYLFSARDGVLTRRRNLEAVREWEDREREDKERKAATRRVHAALFEKFEKVPAAEEWLAVFTHELDRYPFLVVLAPSRAGKTEWAKSLFEHPLVMEVGDLEHFPDTMREFKRDAHDGIVLDDLRDMYFLVRHQEKLQGKVDVVSEFASTPSGTYSYTKWLWKVPIVITANYTTRNLDLLKENDFLANPGNRVVVERTAPPQKRRRAE